MGNRVKAKRRSQQKSNLVVVKTKARRAGVSQGKKPARPLALGRVLNDVGDERSWMDWVTPEQIKVAARRSRADS